MSAVPASPTLPALRPPPASRVPGVLLAAVLAAIAMALGQALPLLGGAVLGIVLGMAVGHVFPPAPRYAPGIAFAGKQVLQGSIILLGFGLNLGQVLHTGLESLAVTLVTVGVAFASAWLLGRWLRVPAKLGVLIGAGTAICGGSAIAAVTPIVKPDEHDTAYAMSTIFLFNVVAVLLFPPLGHWLGLSDAGFGLWAGTAINDTSSVVAAGYHYSAAAGDHATIVKLTRATLIVPVCLVLAAWQAWKLREGGGFRIAQAFPWFILGFLLASALRSAGLVPDALLPLLHAAAEFVIVAAMTAIGLSANLRRMAGTGPRPLLLGLGTWAAVAIASLVVQALSGRL